MYNLISVESHAALYAKKQAIFTLDWTFLQSSSTFLCMKSNNLQGQKQTKKSQPDRKRAELALSRVRSAITNGSELLAGVDHRSARMRRLKDLIGGHVADLGGRNLLSEAEFCLVRRCALLTLELELMEAKFEANDGAKAAELECYQRVASSLRRLLESLGLKRRPRDVGPDLGHILRHGHRGRIVDAEVGQ